jgi:predicted nucleotide-binding protein (sugar kinase/HSP70/actin superfamily)
VQIQVGIPQAMLYHEFGSLWNGFFQNMNIPVTVSGDTNKHMLDRGTILAMDESCLPLKVYLGHIDSLLSSCSHIFVPRIVQYHQHFYFCSKFAGLPDIVCNTFGLSTERLISPNMDEHLLTNQLRAVYTTCHTLGVPAVSGYLAYRQALQSWRSQVSPDKAVDKDSIAVIGHSYLVKDTFFCQDVEQVLTSYGVTMITSDQIASKVLYDESKVFEPDVYWQLSAKIAGAAHFFCRQKDVKGVILLSSFGCGPDSLVNEYIEHHVLKKSGKPYIMINLDEHTGRAGLITRVEAFLDLMEWRKKG